MKPTYLDFNATTPLCPEAFAAMEPWLTGGPGNPSSSHVYGREAATAVSRAREQVAGLVGARPHEIVFTAGGTEADNLAILGARAEPGRLVISAVEHPAVTGPAAWLKERGWRVEELPVDGTGRIAMDRAAELLATPADLVSVILAQNETGVIQPVAELSALARAANPGVIVHTDAAQALGKIAVDVRTLGVDLLTVVGHKLYGPQGIGALYVKTGTALHPLLAGGGQERGLRPGTEPVASIVGLGAACVRAGRELAAEAAGIERRRDRLWELLQAGVPGIRRTGEGAERLPNTLHVRFPGVSGAAVLAGAPGVAASTGSACHEDDGAPSGALGAMGLETADALGAVRLSLGRTTTDEEVEAAGEELVRSYTRLAGG